MNWSKKIIQHTTDMSTNDAIAALSFLNLPPAGRMMATPLLS